MPRKPDTDGTGQHVYPQHRVMSLMGRGITALHSDLKDDFERLMPHAKREAKYDCSRPTSGMLEVARMRHCDTIAFWETKHHRDLILWVSRYPHGPTVKFHVYAIKTSNQAGFLGNFRRYTRPVLSFSSSFDDRRRPEVRIFKECLKQLLGTPHLHHRSAPFVDHVVQLTKLGPADQIHLRTYEITGGNPEEMELREAGPSATLVPMAILRGCMAGDLLWTNGGYMGPTQQLALQRELRAVEKRQRTAAQKSWEFREVDRPVDEVDAVLGPESYAAAFRGGLIGPGGDSEESDESESSQSSEGSGASDSSGSGPDSEVSGSSGSPGSSGLSGPSDGETRAAPRPKPRKRRQ